MDAAQVKELALPLLCEEYHPLIDLWLSNASKRELKGLRVAYAVCKHRGRKRFLRKEAVPVTARKASKQLSSYTQEFGQVAPVRFDSEVLQFKKLSDFLFSSVLTPTSLLFIERWVQLKDSPDFTSLLLDFLRGFYSVVKIHVLNTSYTMRETHYKFSEAERSRFASVTPRDRQLPVTSKASRLRTNYRSASIDCSQPRRAVRIDPITPRDRFLRNLKGCGDLTEWVGNGNIDKTSSYQTSYVTTISPRRSHNPINYKTSVVGRVLPEIKSISN